MSTSAASFVQTPWQGTGSSRSKGSHRVTLVSITLLLLQQLVVLRYHWLQQGIYCGVNEFFSVVDLLQQ